MKSHEIKNKCKLFNPAGSNDLLESSRTPGETGFDDTFVIHECSSLCLTDLNLNVNPIY